MSSMAMALSGLESAGALDTFCTASYRSAAYYEWKRPGTLRGVHLGQNIEAALQKKCRKRKSCKDSGKIHVKM